jgi:hypothetical protein
MKKLMTAMLGLSLLTGLAAVSFARPDDTKTESTKKKSKSKSKTKKDTSKTEASK